MYFITLFLSCSSAFLFGLGTLANEKGGISRIRHKSPGVPVYLLHEVWSKTDDRLCDDGISVVRAASNRCLLIALVRYSMWFLSFLLLQRRGPAIGFRHETPVSTG